MANLNVRSSELEIMDDLHCSGEVLAQTLRELEFINKWLGGNAVTLNAFKAIFKNQPKQKTYHIADLGCGGGDMAKHIYDWGKKHGYAFEIVGIDANPNVVEYARKHVGDVQAITFKNLNIFSPEFESLNFDVVIGTLFYHHFSNNELISFFRKLKEQIRIGFIINDIHRHPLAFHSIKILTGLFSKSSMVRNDAPLSVNRAFSRNELEAIVKEAGYEDVSIRWKWAFRWEVVVKV